MQYRISFYIPYDDATKEEREGRDSSVLFFDQVLQGRAATVMSESLNRNTVIRDLKLTTVREVEDIQSVVSMMKTLDMIPQSATLASWDSV